MRKIIGMAFVSLDGVMQAPGGETEDPSGEFNLGGWTVQFADQKSGDAVIRMVGTITKPNDLLLGRGTYDIFAAFWPHVPAENPIGAAFSKATKYVMTKAPRTFEWANTHQLHSIDELKKVKAGAGPDIVVWGSSTLYPQLFEANLIDRLLLLTFPVALGKGKKLFGNTTRPVTMKLLASEVTTTGVIISTYDLSRPTLNWQP